jgi:ubiquinone/menaquinone biosynthesis C-methylase UbiE
MFSPKTYVGFDIDAERLSFAGRLHRNHTFILGQRGHLPFGTETFDVIFTCAVLHHLSDADVESYALEFDRVLRPNGVIIIVEPAYRADATASNMFMTICDQGRYIRNIDHYAQLLIPAFDVRLHFQYRAPNLYNNAVLSARRRLSRRGAGAQSAERSNTSSFSLIKTT